MLEETLRLSRLQRTLFKRARVERSRAGGRKAVPDSAIHPALRIARPAVDPQGLYRNGRLRRAPPCWRPSCDNTEACNAGVDCSVYAQAVREHGEGSQAFGRALLAEGPFRPESAYSYLNPFGDGTSGTFRRACPCRRPSNRPGAARVAARGRTAPAPAGAWAGERASAQSWRPGERRFPSSRKTL